MKGGSVAVKGSSEKVAGIKSERDDELDQWHKDKFEMLHTQLEAVE